MALRSDLSGEWSAAEASGDERGERGYRCRWADRAVCAVGSEAGVELGGLPATRIRTRDLFNALNVRRLLRGQWSVSGAKNGRRLSRDDRRTATQNLEALPSAQK